MCVKATGLAAANAGKASIFAAAAMPRNPRGARSRRRVFARVFAAVLIMYISHRDLFLLTNRIRTTHPKQQHPSQIRGKEQRGEQPWSFFAVALFFSLFFFFLLLIGVGVEWIAGGEA